MPVNNEISPTPQTALILPVPTRHPFFWPAVVILVLGIAAIWFSGVPTWLKALITMLTLVYAIFEYQRGQQKSRPKTLRRSASGHWTVIDYNDQSNLVTPLKDSVVTPWLVVFQGRTHKQRVNLWWLRKSLPEEEFRRLCMYLHQL